MSDTEFFKPVPAIIAFCAALITFVGTQSVVAGIVVLAIVYRVIGHLSGEIEKVQKPQPATITTASESSAVAQPPRAAASPVVKPDAAPAAPEKMRVDTDDRSLQRKLKMLRKEEAREAKAANTRKSDAGNRANTRARRDSERKQSTAAAKAERRAETRARNERLDAGATQKKQAAKSATPRQVAIAVDPNVLWLEQLRQLDAKIVTGELTDEAYEREYDRIMDQRDADLQKFGILSIDDA